ncbi:hypothetical protein [Pyxidicoccus xibeiensis]|uniref:hypothetical protein n=1 Tax=Pyxidicoccus xibeiensis TaxID=2906759 RepID=UPI0020A7C2CE|nr:hypothetical protein [Pyxidicoccus xibeiensis]MCP3142068.1 hypothetical protein [Pyxidicoccus xibeiensis]
MPTDSRTNSGSGLRRSLGLLVEVGRDAKAGRSHRLHLVQRHRKSRQIVVGVALEVRIAARGHL